MMLELARPFPVNTPLGYGWAFIVSRESNFANDIWTCAMEKDGAIVHFRSDQISVLPNGTLDIQNTNQDICKSNTTKPTAEQHSAGKRKARTRRHGAGRST